jgi:transposase InsO family protein
LPNQKKRQVSKEVEAKIGKTNRKLLSSVLKISRRNLYCQNNGQNNTKDVFLKDQILKVLEINPSYGHRRIALALGIGKKRARRVMKLFGIKPYKRKGRWTKKRDYGKPPSRYLNLIKGSCPIKPNVVFAGDFTRLIWNQKIIYLATFIDLFTREIVGWSVSTKHTTEFVIEAYLDAVRTAGKSIIVHTDQGSEYNSGDYATFMEHLGVKISISKKASPWENAYQESFYDNFKTDLGAEFERSETIGEFVEAIHKTINYYNNQRIHTKLKMSPVKFKLKFLTNHI